MDAAAPQVHARRALEVEEVTEASRYAPLVPRRALQDVHLAADSRDHLSPLCWRNVSEHFPHAIITRFLTLAPSHRAPKRLEVGHHVLLHAREYRGDGSILVIEKLIGLRFGWRVGRQLEVLPHQPAA